MEKVNELCLIHRTRLTQNHCRELYSIRESTHLEKGGCRMKEDIFDNSMPLATLCLSARRLYTFWTYLGLGAGWYIGQVHMPKCIPDPLSLHEDLGSETNW